MTVEYVGNCGKILGDIIDWHAVIDSIKDQTPAYVGPSHKRGDTIPGLDEIIDRWDNAGYKLFKDGGTVEWDMFLPGINFSEDIVKKFANFVGIAEWNTAWISRINQGRMAPLHWDIHDNEVQFMQEPDKIRFHCHISQPAFGHVVIVDDKCFYNETQGATYKWSSRRLWHGGANAGVTPKYLFNFW